MPEIPQNFKVPSVGSPPVADPETAEIIAFPAARRAPFVTVLRPRTAPRCVTKTIMVEGGVLRRDPAATAFASEWQVEVVPVADFDDFADLLTRLADEGRAALVHGAPENPGPVARIRRRATHFPARSNLLTVDIDHLPLPDDVEMLSADTAAKLAEHLRPALPEPLRSARFLLQLTGSHGAWKGDAAPDGARVRLWFICNRPVERVEIEVLFARAEVGGKSAPVLIGGGFGGPIPIDTSVWRNVQVNFIANPVIEGDEPDPLAGARLYATDDDGGLLDDFVALPPPAALEARVAALGIRAASSSATAAHVGEIDPEVALARFASILRSVPKPLTSACKEGSRHLALANLYMQAMDAGVESDEAAEVVAEWAMGETDGVANVADAGALDERLVAKLHTFDGSYRGPFGKEYRPDWDDRGTDACSVPCDDEGDDVPPTSTDLIAEVIDRNPALASFRFTAIDKRARAELAKAESRYLEALFAAHGVSAAAKTVEAARKTVERSTAALAAARAAAARKSAYATKWGGFDDPLDFDGLEERVLVGRRPDVLYGLIPADAVAMLYAPPAHFKTFLALRFAWCVAMGRTIDGRPTPRRRVVYVTGEGAARFADRVLALKSEEEAANPGGTDGLGEWLRIVHLPDLDLLDPAAVESLTANLLRWTGETDGGEIGLVLLDTLRKLAPSLDEIDSPAVSSVIANMQSIGEATGASVLYCHHTNKANASFRGSSTFLGDTDVVMQVTKTDGTFALVFDKMKDGAVPASMSLEINEVLLGDDPDPAATKPLSSKTVALAATGAGTEAFKTGSDDAATTAPVAEGWRHASTGLLRDALAALSPADRVAGRDEARAEVDRRRKVEHTAEQAKSPKGKRKPYEPVSDDNFRMMLNRAIAEGAVTANEDRSIIRATGEGFVSATEGGDDEV